MIRRVVRFVTITVVVAAAVAAARTLTNRRDPLPTTPTPSGAAWPPVTPPAEPSEPSEPAPQMAPEPQGVPVADGRGWVDPDASGGCPDGYPIKAKMSSKIFHAPGQLNYERTTPDRCYRDAAAATADGLRAAKR